MIPVSELAAGSPSILAELLRISLLGAVFIIVVAVVLRFARGVVPPRVQCWLWWFACLRLLLGFVPMPGLMLELPERWSGLAPAAALLVAPEAASGPGIDAARALAGDIARQLGDDVRIDALSVPQGHSVAIGTDSRPALIKTLSLLLLSLWVLGATLGIGALLIQWLRARRFLGSAYPWSEADSEAFARLCRREGVSRIPRVLVSGEIGVPQITGVRHPVILLPPLFDRLDPLDREMALCHELAHLRRRDLLWGWAPTLAVRVFWFHPLAWLAAREYALAREAACDVEVLRSVDTAPWSYGRLLVLFARSPRGPLMGAAGVALGTSSLKRRLEMMRTSYRNDRAIGAWGALALAVVVGILPLRFVVSPAEARKARSETKTSRSTWSIETGSDREVRTLIILEADEDRIRMMGDTAEIDDAKRARRKSSAPTVLWFRTREGTWLVDDEKVVAAVVEAFGPVEELGDKQGELGGRQGELGSKQSELGARQAELGMEQARLSLRISALSSEIAQRGMAGRRTDDLEAELAEIQAEMEALSWAQSELGEVQGELGERQGELGSIQGELGQLQARESKKLEETLDDLLMRAIETGTARPVK